MRTYDPFNRAEIISGTLNFIQEAKGDEIIDRIIDQTLQPGVWIPANATAVDIQDGLPSQFIITDAGGGNIDVAVGTAYNVDGERVEVPAGDSTPYNSNAPAFTTTITGVGNIQGTTPYSTGRLTVPPPTPGTPGLRFVFIQYVQVVKTKSLPPNHATSSGTVVTIGLGDPDTKKPLLELDQKTGQIYAPQRINGYQITVAELSGITVPGGTNVPALNVDQKAIYIGRYELLAGPAVSNIVLSDSTYARRVMLFRPVTGAKVDPTNPPAIYGASQTVTPQEHVSATGSGTIAPTNPHGLSISDITGGGLEPENIIYQKETVEDGIIDLQNDRNNPIPASEAVEPTIVNTPVPTTSWLSRVEFLQLTTNRHAMFISGERLTRIEPQLSIYTATPTDTQAVVGFGSADASGTYIIYAYKSATEIATLAKIISSGSLPADSLPVAEVYWDNSATSLRKSRVRDSSLSSPNTEQQETPALPFDNRSIGLVATPQIATKALRDPYEGMFAKKEFVNRLGNGGFVHISGNGFTAYGWTALRWGYRAASPWIGAPVIVLGGAGATATASILNATADPTMYNAGGPKIETGTKLVFTPITASNLMDVRFAGQMNGLKPLTTYTVSAYVKLPTANSSFDVLGSFVESNNAPGGVNQVWSDVKTFKIDRSNTGWQRVSLSLTTNSSVDASVSLGWFEFMLINQNLTGVGWSASEFWISNMVITEGEWVDGAEYSSIPLFYAIRGGYASTIYTSWTNIEGISFSLDRPRLIHTVTNKSFSLRGTRSAWGAYLRLLLVNATYPGGLEIARSWDFATLVSAQFRGYSSGEETTKQLTTQAFIFSGANYHTFYTQAVAAHSSPVVLLDGYTTYTIY